MILIISMLLMPSCSRRAPELEDVYDRLVEVIEASHEVNVVLFGAGLPVYERDSAEEALVHRYYNVAENGQEYVTVYSKYTAVDEIKVAVEKVYGKEYRESLYETLFTGYAMSEISDTVLPARYYEDENWMYQNANVDPLVTGVRVYDYSTMTIVSPSNAERIRVEVMSYSESMLDEWAPITLNFIYEEGNWYLDGPSC